KPVNNLKYNKKTDQEAGYSARIKATEGYNYDEHIINTTQITQDTNIELEETNIDIPSTSKFVNRKRKRINEPIRLSTLNFLEEKHMREEKINIKQLEIEEKKLELDRQKLLLETERFELEKKERLQKLDLEKREREQRLDIEKKEREEKLKLEAQKVEIAGQQQKLLQLMLEQLIKKS
ncbi:Uncharacterized protein FWK35_00030839, partial [Aphis craccivora]